MSVFTRDEIAFFREQYANQLRPNARGVDQDGFVKAISASVAHTGLGNPGVDQFVVSFNKIKNRDGVVAWPQFFQALQKIRNQVPTQSTDGAPVGLESYVGFVEAAPNTLAAGGGGNIERGRSLGRTLRRGLGTMGTAVGNWFGVTGDPSESNPLWQEENRLQSGASLTLGRSRSQRRRTESISYDPDTDVGAPPVVLASPLIHSDDSLLVPESRPPPQSSFALVDFESSSSEDDVEAEDDGFISAAPPDYSDVVPNAPPPARPLSMPPVDSGAGSRPDVTRNRASAYVTMAEPAPVRSVATRATPTQRQEPGFVYDAEDGFQYYLNFIKKERNCLRNRAQQNARSFFGGDGNPPPEAANEGGLQRDGSIRRDRISNRHGRWPKFLQKKNRKLSRQSATVQQEVESLPTFFPFFILLVTILQVVAFIVMAIRNGLAPVNIRPLEETITASSLSESSGNITKTITLSTNLWVGPRIVHLIQWGARYKPCMRGDDQITARSTRDSTAETEPLGCCVHEQNFGSVLLADCAGRSDTLDISVVLAGNVSGSSFLDGMSCRGFGLDSTFHPCCVSVTGGCVLVSESECNARGGYPHPELETCRDVNCLRDICGFDGVFVPVERPIAAADGNTPAPNQFWRWVTPLAFHMGLIQLIIVLGAQLYLGIKIERYAGWLRVGLIYFISGVGGLLVSAVFVPYEVYFGASGAVCGLLAVFLVELLQTWKINDYAWLELIVFIVAAVILAFLGTLPYVDNFVHIGGFVFGLLGAMIFLPWVTFSKYTKQCRCIVLLVSVPLTFVLVVFGFLVFYLLPDSQSNFCPWCHYLNCIPYFPGLCDITNPAPSSENLTTIGL